MRKKIMSVALVTALATTMLAGCGGNNSSDNKSSDEGNKDADNKAKVEITLGNWPTDDRADDIAMFEGYIKTFNEKYPDVTVTPKQYTYATDTFVSLAESGSCPTIFETWYTEPQKLIQQGLVADITEQVKSRGWDTEMLGSVKDLLTDKDGKIYGIPRDAYVLGIMCNAELFQEAGLAEEDGTPIFPKTWDELAETAKTIKDKTKAAGFCLLAKDNAGGWHFSNIAWNFGADLVTDNGDGTYTAHLDSEEAIAAMNYVHDLKWKYDVLTADPMSEDWGTGFQQIGTGACAMYIGANDAVAQPTQVNGLAVDKLAMCPIPAGPKGDQWGLTGGSPYMFSKDATPEQIDAALNFVEVMGKGPTANETAIAGMKADAANRVANQTPVIKSFPAWTNQERIDAEAKVVEEYKNVDSKMFDSYFNGTANVRAEEEGDAQEMYAQLTSVLQAVISKENADIPALMKGANDAYQTILDQKFTKK